MGSKRRNHEGHATLQTMPMDLSSLNSEFQMSQRETLRTTQKQKGQGSSLQSQFNSIPVEATGVFYHQHPLNKNVETSETGRYARGSRKNLKPIV